MYNRVNNFLSLRFLLIVLLTLVIYSCSNIFYTTDNDEEIELPRMLGYSVVVMEASKGFYDNVLLTSAELYEKGVIDDDDVDDIILIANRYRSSHNTAQVLVESWFNVYTGGRGEVNQTEVITEVLRLVSLAPEILNDINTIAGTDMNLPPALQIDFLLSFVKDYNEIE